MKKIIVVFIIGAGMMMAACGKADPIRDKDNARPATLTKVDPSELKLDLKNVKVGKLIEVKKTESKEAPVTAVTAAQVRTF